MAAKPRQPFFSIVIPCYNDGRYAPGQYIDRLLTNLTQQGLSKLDLEVIIVDDASPIPYDATVRKYSKKLNIRTIGLTKNEGQANARDAGAQTARGEWLTFADHDDLFYVGALKAVKKIIQDSKEKYVVYSAFNKVSNSNFNLVIEEFQDPNLDTWLHGKFYNVKNLWQACDIHFVEGLRSHEDIALGSLVKCALHSLGLSQDHHFYINVPVYMWVDNPQSISNSEYVSKKIGGTEYGFHEVSFSTFIEATSAPFIIAYERGWLTRDEAIVMRLIELMKHWCSLDAFMKADPINYLKVNEAYCSQEYHFIKEDFGLTLAQVKVICATSLNKYKSELDKLSVSSALPDLYSWLDHLDSMQYQSMINEWDARLIRDQRIAEQEPDKVNKHHNRPFYSLVIACYNDGRYKEGVYLDRLLGSVTRQGLEHDDIEVILSDDCSPVSFDNIAAKYEDKLIICRTKTDYNCCPGNTRAKGVEIATGQWLCFADHDDIFYDGALLKVKEGIISKGEKHYAFGDFYGVDPDGNITRSFEMTMNWCHAKFYNVDNFWKPMGIHFIKDLKSHEDIAICTQVGCALEALKRTEYTYFHFPVYAWTDNPQSVSHAKYTVETETGTREFLEVFFNDYVHSTGYIYIDMFKDNKISIVYAVNRVLEVMLYCYFYTEAFMFKRPDDYYTKNLAYAGQYVRDCKSTFNMTNESMHNAIAGNGAVMYLDIRKQADPGCGHYMPIHTLKEWFEIVCACFTEL